MIDDDFDGSLADIAARDETYSPEYDVAAAWEAIRGDLRSRGPFTRMLLELRGTAHAAMTDLVYCDPSDAGQVAKLQGEVRRYIHLMTILQQYRASSEVAEANHEGDLPELTDEDYEFVANLER
jgi:hypothetical protein